MKKKIVLPIAIFSLLISLSFVGESYAKYVTTVSNIATMSVARWKILVNNNDILENQQASQIITPTIITNNHIKNNVIAPTSKGYFDLVIDSTNTDVSFSYNISSSIAEDSEVSDLIITGYSLNNGNIISITSDDEITGNVMYLDTNKVNTIRIYIEWSDNVTDSMDNVADTNANDGLAKINVTLSFIQLASIGE